MAAGNTSTSPPIQLAPATDLSILDFLLPRSVSTAAQQLLAGNSFVNLLCVCGILLYVTKRVWQEVENHLTSRVHVIYWSDTYDMVIPWISSQPFAGKARSFLCRVDRTEEKSLKFLPWNDTFPFFHRRRLFWLRSSERDVGYRKEEIISIWCFGRDPAPLHQLLRDCRTEYLNSTRNQIVIYENQGDKWKQTKSRVIRPMPTIIMDEKKKADLLDDVRKFLSPRSQAYYSARGISYRRGYLFYGSPGTGKTTLSFAMAGEHKLPIYAAKLSMVDSNGLSLLVAELPPRCLLLLEDVDAVGITQSRQAPTGKTGEPEASSIEPQSKLSLSDLLNAIDGVSSQEGRLLIMTTNHPELLDDALIRAGRVDKEVEFLNADKDMIRQLFCLVFTRLEQDVPDPENLAEDDKTVERLATEFACKVPERKFSPADIESYLLVNRDSPCTAVEKAEEWVTKTREEKKNKRRKLEEGEDQKHQKTR